MIYLKDNSEHGSFLAKRWSDLHRAENNLPDIQEIDDRIEKGDETVKEGESMDPCYASEGLEIQNIYKLCVAVCKIFPSHCLF